MGPFAGDSQIEGFAMYRIVNALKDRLFGSKPRVERRKQAASSSQSHNPEPGATIIYHHFMMTVTRTRTSEVWKWLAKHGWRVNDFRNDRRRYSRLPADTYSRLDLAAPSERPMILRSLTRQQ